jgi:hypothetical protein
MAHDQLATFAVWRGRRLQGFRAGVRAMLPQAAA